MTHDLLSSFNSKSQIDVAILDFSKAFDTVPHAGLLGKLEHYGIDSKILLWITNFLNKRKQRVVVDGSFSNYADVESSVPQGTVLDFYFALSLTTYHLVRLAPMWQQSGILQLSWNCRIPCGCIANLNLASFS